MEPRSGSSAAEAEGRISDERRRLVIAEGRCTGLGIPAKDFPPSRAYARGLGCRTPARTQLLAIGRLANFKGCQTRMVIRNKHEPLMVGSTTTTFAEVAETTSANPGFRERLASADALILPLQDILDYEGPVFPAVTRELYEFLRTAANGQVDVEVATEDDEIEELVLHGDLIVLGILLVKAAAANITFGLLTNFLYDRIKKKSGDAESTTVRCELVIEEDGVSRSLKYDGPASTFEKLLGAGLGYPKLERGDRKDVDHGA
jgi:hypothetical protein